MFHARETVGKRDTWNVADCDAYWHLLRDRSRHPLPRRVCLFVYLSGIITRRWKRKGAKQNTRRWTSHFGRIGIFLTLYYTSSVNVNGNGWHRRDGGGPRSESVAGGAAASPTSAAKKDVASNEEKRETACQVYCTLYTRRWRIKNMIAHTCSSSPSQSFPSSHPLAAIRQKSLEGWSDDETFLFWLAWPLDVVWEHAWWPRRSWEKGSSTL